MTVCTPFETLRAFVERELRERERQGGFGYIFEAEAALEAVAALEREAVPKEATPEMIAAAWKVWDRVRNGAGPAFKEAINAALKVAKEGPTK